MQNHPNVSLRDKIAQMLIVGFDGKQVTEQSLIVRQLDGCYLGGVLLFDYNFTTKTYDKNIENPTQVKNLNAELQHYNAILNKKHQRPERPLLIAVDYEGGAVNRLKESYGFPETVSAQKIGKMSHKKITQASDKMAETLKAAGFNLNFAPVLDVNVNPENPILGKLERCFSDRAQEVVDIARIYVKSFEEQGIKACYKHFPGHGSSQTDSHLGFVDVTNTWIESELEPYRYLRRELDGCKMIMTAHIINRQLDDTGLPATLSYKILTELLRQELNYDGVIITDDMQMKAISDHYSLEESLQLAVNAGADMFIFGNQLSKKPQDPVEVVDIIEKCVREGSISEKRIDDAYARICKLRVGKVCDRIV